MQKYPRCDLGVEEAAFDAEEIETPGARTAGPTHRLYKPLHIFMCAEFRSELARAEIADEISEFCALSFQAILAIAEGSEFAIDYLEMVEAAAASAFDSAIVTSIQNTYDLVRRDPSIAAERCLTLIGQLCHTEGLCRGLLIALARLGDLHAIDAVERGFVQQALRRTPHFTEPLPTQQELCGTAVPRVPTRRIAG
jgi:hypothetical protein